MTINTSQNFAADITEVAADNIATEPSYTAFAVDAEHVPLEGGTDPAYGTVQWRTLINGTPNAPKEFILGIGELGPHGTLPAHRHEPAEFYLGIEGEGTVTIEGVPHQMKSGVAIYLPANAEHSILAGPEGLRFAYGFAEGNFAEIEYYFTK